MEVSKRKKREKGRRGQAFVFPQNTQSRNVLVKICIWACSADQLDMSTHKTAPDGSQQTQKACRIAVMTCQRIASSVEVELIGMCGTIGRAVIIVSHLPTTDKSTMRKRLELSWLTALRSEAAFLQPFHLAQRTETLDCLQPWPYTLYLLKWPYFLRTSCPKFLFFCYWKFPKTITHQYKTSTDSLRSHDPFSSLNSEPDVSCW